MLVLDTTSLLLRINTSAATAVKTQFTFVDNTTTTFVPGAQRQSIAAAGNTTVVAAPGAASTQRNIKSGSIVATGGAQTIRVEVFDGTAFEVIPACTLATNEGLHYEEGRGWYVKTASGDERGLSQLLRAPQILTSGTSISHPSGTRLIKVSGCGGGGAGGGLNAAAGALGTGGASGSWGERTFAAASTTSTFAIGAAGTGVSGANGNNGGSTTFTHNGVTVTFPGGGGGVAVAGSAAAGTAGNGGTPGGAPTNADWGANGQSGGDALKPQAGTQPCWAGGGGSTPYGAGGSLEMTTSTQGPGIAGTGFGAGGGGCCNGTTATALAGPNGTQGILIVQEFS